MNIYAEQITEFTHNGYNIRVWVEHDPQKVSLDLDIRTKILDVCEQQKLFQGGFPLIVIAKAILNLPGINAVQVDRGTVHGWTKHGVVLYKDWP